MSQMIVIASPMHKIANIPVNVKYRRPGNVIAYLPVEFEIFKEGEYFRAIPLQDLQNRILTNLPKELLFKVKDGIIYNNPAGTDAVVQDILRQLVSMNEVETPQEVFVETTSTSTKSMSFI
jgi:hypothetical protein